ncbi:MAG: hypothetical protein ACLQAT_00010 [Candidatus Binataceae bacterium]
MISLENQQFVTHRLEELFLSLQPAIKRGDSKAIEAAVRVLGLKAKVLYPTPMQVDISGKNGAPITLAVSLAGDEVIDPEQAKRLEHTSGEKPWDKQTEIMQAIVTHP